MWLWEMLFGGWAGLFEKDDPLPLPPPPGDGTDGRSWIDPNG